MLSHSVGSNLCPCDFPSPGDLLDPGVEPTGRQILYHWATWKALFNPYFDPMGRCYLRFTDDDIDPKEVEWYKTRYLESSQLSSWPHVWLWPALCVH